MKAKRLKALPFAASAVRVMRSGTSGGFMSDMSPGIPASHLSRAKTSLPAEGTSANTGKRHYFSCTSWASAVVAMLNAAKTTKRDAVSFMKLFSQRNNSRNISPLVMSTSLQKSFLFLCFFRFCSATGAFESSIRIKHTFSNTNLPLERILHRVTGETSSQTLSGLSTLKQEQESG